MQLYETIAIQSLYRNGQRRYVAGYFMLFACGSVWKCPCTDKIEQEATNAVSLALVTAASRGG